MSSSSNTPNTQPPEQYKCWSCGSIISPNAISLSGADPSWGWGNTDSHSNDNDDGWSDNNSDGGWGDGDYGTGKTHGGTGGTSYGTCPACGARLSY